MRYWFLSWNCLGLNINACPGKVCLGVSENKVLIVVVSMVVTLPLAIPWWLSLNQAEAVFLSCWPIRADPTLPPAPGYHLHPALWTWYAPVENTARHCMSNDMTCNPTVERSANWFYCLYCILEKRQKSLQPISPKLCSSHEMIHMDKLHYKWEEKYVFLNFWVKHPFQGEFCHILCFLFLFVLVAAWSVWFHDLRTFYSNLFFSRNGRSCILLVCLWVCHQDCELSVVSALRWGWCTGTCLSNLMTVDLML